MIITSLLVTFDIYAECVKNVPYPSMERLLTERFATIDIVIFIPFVGKFLKGYLAQVRKSVDSPPGMLTEDHHHTVHEERQVCYSSHLRPKSLHL